ncbi:metabolite traffic protein EboE [Streptomyces xinghaiensis]|uniref:metabolite traffic protein EboE n=1 Tax=Streptomyces xinghaiensis TaxID=1038928 RepID=UPI002E12B759|nr:metabolite traffic protein EboE [Streptomyces xinghaiensis]
MRFRHPDGSTVHLAYCTNVHPAETLDGVLRQLREHCEPVRRRLGRDRLGIGLWLARDAARALVADPAALRTLRSELDRRGLEVVTLNGFPYAGFGAERVKYRVYRPDWTEPERLGHTTDLARLLAGLLPDDEPEGTISTLPLAWRTPYNAASERTARRALTLLAQRLDALQDLTGTSIRIGLEPEPGCTVATTADAVTALGGRGRPPSHRIGVCLDTCHLATEFEEPGPALDALTGAGIPVVKAQLSAALHAENPGREDVRAALAAFAEPRFLHQTRTRTRAGEVTGTDDLDEALGLPAEPPARSEGAGSPGPALPAPALPVPALPTTGPWRVHLHVPLHAAPLPPLTSTLPVLRDTLTRLVGGPAPLTRHLEVETYTWQALPPELRPRSRARLAEGIAAELCLVRDLLTDLGLKELP